MNGKEFINKLKELGVSSKTLYNDDSDFPLEAVPFLGNYKKISSEKVGKDILIITWYFKDYNIYLQAEAEYNHYVGYRFDPFYEVEPYQETITKYKEI